MDLKKSLYVASSGLQAEAARMRVIAQNIANADSTGNTPGADPYRRKTISFKNVFDKELGVDVVEVDKYGVDKSDFIKKYDPSHPAADAQGYVKTPNVNPIIENADMLEAQRSYQANLSVIDNTKTMIARTLDMIR